MQLFSKMIFIIIPRNSASLWRGLGLGLGLGLMGMKRERELLSSSSKCKLLFFCRVLF